MKPFSRSDRVGGQIQKMLSGLLTKEVKDPRLELVTITGVKMTADLRTARIYFAMTGGRTSREQAIEGFAMAKGFLKRMLSRQLGLRYMPDLLFCYDQSFDYGAHIDRILESLDAEDATSDSSSDQK